MCKKILYAMLGVLLLIVLDQGTKILIVRQYMLGEHTVIIPHFFSLTYIRNYGAVFGFLNDPESTWQFWFFLFSLIPAFYLLYYYTKHNNNSITWIAVSLIAAGALGNTIDRIQYGFVVDFLDFYIKTYHWPAFNIADICIVLGVILLLFEPYYKRTSKEQ